MLTVLNQLNYQKPNLTSLPWEAINIQVGDCLTGRSTVGLAPWPLWYMWRPVMNSENSWLTRLLWRPGNSGFFLLVGRCTCFYCWMATRSTRGELKEQRELGKRSLSLCLPFASIPRWWWSLAPNLESNMADMLLSTVVKASNHTDTCNWPVSLGANQGY